MFLANESNLKPDFTSPASGSHIAIIVTEVNLLVNDAQL